MLGGLSLFASIGYAQTSNYPALTVKVPFAFVVGNQTFPDGIYKFRSLLKSVPSKAAIDVLEVRSAEGRLYQAIVTDVVGSEKPSDPKLVFTRSGGRAFLSEVWETGWLPDSAPQRCYASSGERKRQSDPCRAGRALKSAGGDRSFGQTTGSPVVLVKSASATVSVVSELWCA